VECLAETDAIVPSSCWVTCPDCRFRGLVPSACLGRRVRCRRCALRFRVGKEAAVPGFGDLDHDPDQVETIEVPTFPGACLWEIRAVLPH